ncbi:MAG: DNA polymerase clamp loader subunit A [Pseudomonadota bacterium]|jgi:hypothetical protein|nr:DNA polymerase clamp loader subunit A [Pseudomonadota bacterium]|tara:strand:- start:8025 stop:8408 length:384 start_codon:yes stop_codon:yes gene_type:complete
MTTPFDYVKAISTTKENMIVDDLTEREYNPFIVNRALSMGIDTVLQANEMNQRHHLSKKLQFDFLLNSISKRKRFDKWQKADKSEDLDYVKAYYNYSYPKAVSALSVLSPTQIETIKKKIDNKGGVK